MTTVAVCTRRGTVAVVSLVGMTHLDGKTAVTPPRGGEAAVTLDGHLCGTGATDAQLMRMRAGAGRPR